MKFDPEQPWYHGSPLELSTLRMGSTITQKRELARIFSHKPGIVSVSDSGQFKHDGTSPGYLYIIRAEIQPRDVMPHPQSTMNAGDEWLTTRELRLELLGRIDLEQAEQLTDEDYEMLRDKISRQGQDKGKA